MLAAFTLMLAMLTSCGNDAQSSEPKDTSTAGTAALSGGFFVHGRILRCRTVIEEIGIESFAERCYTLNIGRRVRL